MSRLLCCSLLLFGCFAITGCGGVEEVPALAEPGEDPSEEQQKNWREESMKRGGAPKGYKPPKEDK